MKYFLQTILQIIIALFLLACIVINQVLYKDVILLFLLAFSFGATAGNILYFWLLNIENYRRNKNEQNRDSK